ACAKQFAAQGAKLILVARHIDQLNKIAHSLIENHDVEVQTLPLDIRDAAQVKQQLADLPSQWQEIDILVNNAGLALGLDKIQEADIQDWEIMIDTNIKGLLYVTHYVVQKMLARNSGHIINIGSISGYEIYSGGVVYCASKFAVRAITEGLKMDVHGTPIRVSSVAPGMVETHFSLTRFGGDQQRASDVYRGAQPLMASDIADAVLYCATRPSHVDVREIRISPTTQTNAFMLSRNNE
ncbi:unnamed protein product, partial [marine sediment metagenome]